MTTVDALLRRIEARLRQIEPDLTDAYRRSLASLRALMTDAEIRQLVAGRTSVESVLTEALLARAFRPYRAAIQGAVVDSVRLTAPDIPRVTSAQLTATFDVLDEAVVTAIRDLQTSAMGTLTESVVETVRAYVENGLRDGVHPREVARQLRSVIGMAPHQNAWVANYERDLRTLDPKALGRELTNANLDKLVARHIASGTPIPEAEIAKRVLDYRRSFIALNSDTNVRQHTLDSYRQGRRLAWQSAIKDDFVDGDLLVKTWVHFDAQENPRPEHVALNGTTVPFDEPYPTGQMNAGEGDWNCRCTDRISVRRTRPSSSTASAFA